MNSKEVDEPCIAGSISSWMASFGKLIEDSVEERQKLLIWNRQWKKTKKEQMIYKKNGDFCWLFCLKFCYLQLFYEFGFLVLNVCVFTFFKVLWYFHQSFFMKWVWVWALTKIEYLYFSGKLWKNWKLQKNLNLWQVSKFLGN